MFGWSLKECLKFTVKSWIIIFWKYFATNGVPRILTLFWATAKETMNYLEILLMDEQQIIGQRCLLANSDWLTIVIVFELSCLSLLKMLNIWVIPYKLVYWVED